MIFLIILISFLIGFSHEFLLLKEGDEFWFGISDGNRTVSAKKENLREVVCFDKNGHRKPIKVLRAGKKLKFKGNCAVLGLIYEVEGHKTFLKYLSEDYEGFPKSIGFPLEIIPSVNPVAVPSNKKITLKILYKGKPLKGAQVGVNQEFIGRTRKKGEIRIRVRKGLNIIATYVREGEKYYEAFLLFKQIN
ncbi:DUF4198 domain-containing protein [Aquifex sp.]